MTRFTRMAAIAAAALAVLALTSALAIDRLLGRDVRIVAPAAPEAVALNRELWRQGDPVPDLYGLAASRDARVVLLGSGRLVRPPEDPRLRLLLVDKQRGQNPLQAKTVWFVARRAAGGLLGFALLAGALHAWLRRRRPAPALPRLDGTVGDRPVG